MNCLDSIRKMVDHYPGGRAAIAARLGKTDEVLRKELSGAQSHKLGLLDAETISEMCTEVKSPHCDALASKFASRSGGFLQLPVIDLPEVGLHEVAAGSVKEVSDILTSVINAAADGVISTNDLKSILREVDEARGALAALEQKARAQHRADQPAYVRSVA